MVRWNRQRAHASVTLVVTAALEGLDALYASCMAGGVEAVAGVDATDRAGRNPITSTSESESEGIAIGARLESLARIGPLREGELSRF